MISKCSNCGANLNKSIRCSYCNSIYFDSISPNDSIALVELANSLPCASIANSNHMDLAVFLTNMIDKLDRKTKLRIKAILSAKGYGTD